MPKLEEILKDAEQGIEIIDGWDDRPYFRRQGEPNKYSSSLMFALHYDLNILGRIQPWPEDNHHHYYFLNETGRELYRKLIGSEPVVFEPEEPDFFHYFDTETKTLRDL